MTSMPRWLSGATAAGALAGGLIVLGALLAAAPQLILVPVTVSVVVSILLATRRVLILWDLFAFVLGGLMILGYGFVNIGVFPGVPIPLADLVIVVLGVGVVLKTRFRGPIRAPLFFGAVYAAIATTRLVVDYPTWGMDAIRDYTTAVELLALPLGYWSMRRFGLARWIKMIGVISILGVVYGLLFPFRNVMASFSPIVGLQQPVPLVGFYSGAGVAAGFFACLILQPFGRRSLFLAVLFLPAIAIQQSRGTMISVPLALLVVSFGSGRLAGRMRRATAVVVLMGVVALTLTFSAAPQGRLGPTSVQQITSQLQTLNGGQGPGAGTFKVRTEWFSNVVKRVDAHPLGWAIGLGLGPDLTNGFSTSITLVRKPHDDYLEAYARLGVFGLAAFVLVICTAVAPIFRAARRRSDAAGNFLWWSVAVTIVFAFIAATQPLFAYAYGTVPLFATLGAALALLGDREAERPDA